MGLSASVIENEDYTKVKAAVERATVSEFTSEILVAAVKSNNTLVFDLVLKHTDADKINSDVMDAALKLCPVNYYMITKLMELRPGAVNIRHTSKLCLYIITTGYANQNLIDLYGVFADITGVQPSDIRLAHNNNQLMRHILRNVDHTHMIFVMSNITNQSVQRSVFNAQPNKMLAIEKSILYNWNILHLTDLRPSVDSILYAIDKNGYLPVDMFSKETLKAIGMRCNMGTLFSIIEKVNTVEFAHRALGEYYDERSVTILSHKYMAVHTCKVLPGFIKSMKYGSDSTEAVRFSVYLKRVLKNKQISSLELVNAIIESPHAHLLIEVVKDDVTRYYTIKPLRSSSQICCNYMITSHAKEIYKILSNTHVSHVSHTSIDKLAFIVTRT